MKILNIIWYIVFCFASYFVNWQDKQNQKLNYSFHKDRQYLKNRGESGTRRKTNIEKHKIQSFETELTKLFIKELNQTNSFGWGYQFDLN